MGLAKTEGGTAVAEAESTPGETHCGRDDRGADEEEGGHKSVTVHRGKNIIISDCVSCIISSI